MSTNSNPQYGNGMNVVFPTLVPHRNDGHPDATVAYVVFIHGLFGHPWKTWADEAVSGPRKPFWPGDLLPHSVKNIRIYTFGYDADIEGLMSPASQNSVQAHGANLLQDLHSIMRGRRETSVPFIFIAHSLGGLVLKEALNQSSTSKNRDLKSVAESTHGIIFLGTPHRGSDAASYGKIALTLAKVFAARSPNTQLLRALERSSEVLERIAQSFYQTWDCHPEMQVHSFHEEKDVARLGGMLRMRVVPPECARIGHVNEILGSIPADHQYMAKFKNSSDTGFVRIRNVLNLWVSES